MGMESIDSLQASKRGRFYLNIFIVYLRHSGGSVVEGLPNHFSNGIMDEGVVAAILCDVAPALRNSRSVIAISEHHRFTLISMMDEHC